MRTTAFMAPRSHVYQVYVCVWLFVALLLSFTIFSSSHLVSTWLILRKIYWAWLYFYAWSTILFRTNHFYRAQETQLSMTIGWGETEVVEFRKANFNIYDQSSMNLVCCFVHPFIHCCVFLLFSSFIPDCSVCAFGYLINTPNECRWIQFTGSNNKSIREDCRPLADRRISKIENGQ